MGCARNFGDVGACSDIGPQRLAAAGWVPDCAVPDMIGDEISLLRQGADSPRIIIGNLDAMDWAPSPDGGDSDLFPGSDFSCVLEVEVATF